jgi:hypothetical protein
VDFFDISVGQVVLFDKISRGTPARDEKEGVVRGLVTVTGGEKEVVA